MNGQFEYTFPFSAVTGQEEVKEALLIAAVNPAVTGVLISGEKGTAKSTLVRGLAAIVNGAPFVELPLNITEDRLVGSIDIEKAVTFGKASLDPGLLFYADGGFLYADEINLLPGHIANILIQVAGAGENVVEREGLSLKHSSQFAVIGSMNPEEGKIRPQMLDRFSLYVHSQGERDETRRCEIIKKRLEYEASPETFCGKYLEETERLAKLIKESRKRVEQMTVPDDVISFAANLAEQAQSDGHRAELNLCRAAVSVAALSGRMTVNKEDVGRAARFVLVHRMKTEKDMTELAARELPPAEAANNNIDNEQREYACRDMHAEINSLREMIKGDDLFDGDDFQREESLKRGLELNLSSVNNRLLQGTGKRLKARRNTRKGSYIKYRIPTEKTPDIALDATLRAAAMHGSSSGGKPIEIKRADIREKVRERRTGATILFVVDASGSMGARKRMGAVKGAVLSLLSDAYEKRDTVGIVTFRKDRGECILDFTRSVELAEKRLKAIRTGGKTPLAEGLWKAFELFKTDRIKNPDSMQFMVLISDGKANIASKTDDPVKDALEVAQKIRADKVKSLTLDTETGYMRYGFAAAISEALGGEYMKLDEVTGGSIRGSVSEFIKRKQINEHG